MCSSSCTVSIVYLYQKQMEIDCCVCGTAVVCNKLLDSTLSPPARCNGHSFLLSLTLKQFTNTPMADQTVIALTFCPSSPTNLSMLRNESTDEYADNPFSSRLFPFFYDVIRSCQHATFRRFHFCPAEKIQCSKDGWEAWY